MNIRTDLNYRVHRVWRVWVIKAIAYNESLSSSRRHDILRWVRRSKLSQVCCLKYLCPLCNIVTDRPIWQGRFGEKNCQYDSHQRFKYSSFANSIHQSGIEATPPLPAWLWLVDRKRPAANVRAKRRWPHPRTDRADRLGDRSVNS